MNPLTMSYIEALINSVKEDNAIVALARNYHNGNQTTYMTSRVKEFLDIHDENRKFCINICRTITLAVKDELSVSGFNTTEKAKADGTKAQATWAWDLWTKNHMDAVQAEVHESALSERETFIIVEWDYSNLRPTFTHNYRFTDLENDGDGQGCWMIYKNDDVNQDPICAVKQWTQTDYDETGQPTLRIRRTVYYPDHVEKWIYSSTWEHYIEPPDPLKPEVPPEPWPIPWTRRDGKPRGIPVIHFRNVGMMPEAWDAIPLQDAANKTLVDILASNDLSAFQMIVAIGWYPTTDGEPPKADGSNLLKVGPGQFIGTRDPTGKIDAIKGQDPTPLMSSLQDIIVAAAQITGTPTARFTTTKLIAAAETLKMQDIQLKKKAKDRRILFGDAWESCLVMARKVANDFGTEVALDETIDFDTIWADDETLEDLQAKKSLGVPVETIWSEAGYSQEQISLMKKTDEYRLAIMGKIWPWISSTPEATEILTEMLQALGYNVTLSTPEPEPPQEVDANGDPIPPAQDTPKGAVQPTKPGAKPDQQGVKPERTRNE
jgi:hypothetical protein